jgi:hypothetical protein
MDPNTKMPSVENPKEITKEQRAAFMEKKRRDAFMEKQRKYMEREREKAERKRAELIRSLLGAPDSFGDNSHVRRGPRPTRLPTSRSLMRCKERMMKRKLDNELKQTMERFSLQGEAVMTGTFFSIPFYFFFLFLFLFFLFSFYHTTPHHTT